MERLTVEEFCQKLSDKVPIPGGGGASALAGALGTALGSMAASYMWGKKRFEQYEEQIQSELQTLKDMRAQLIAGIQGDADAFLPLSRAYEMPASDEREKLERHQAIQKALIRAVEAPMGVLECCDKAVGSLAVLLPMTSPLMASDLGSAAALCRACMEASLLNVLINTKSFANRPQAREIDDRAVEISQKGIRNCETIYETVKKLCSEN
jgi:formiminotetrahydrofolate cyclodeaminase